MEKIVNCPLKSISLSFLAIELKVYLGTREVVLSDSLRTQYDQLTNFWLAIGNRYVNFTAYP